MAEEVKKTETTRIGIAALIASIGIPLAQLLIGYFSQQTTQLQNVALEKERRRLEVTKLFLDNYVGKKTDVQIATIQIMKSLDPVFFISIEEGLKQTTHSDTVRASIKRATVEAAHEVQADPNIKNKSKKIQKVLASHQLEKESYDNYVKGDLKTAKIKWQKANQAEIVFPNDELFDKSSKWTEIKSGDLKNLKKSGFKDLKVGEWHEVKSSGWKEIKSKN
jgi:ABC-type Na+ efflux pump permease subunit